jgi:hypothetical protein
MDHETTTEAKPVSYQRRWQIRMEDDGRCGHCGKPAVRAGHCRECREKKNNRARNRYRLAHGIPIDAPIGPQGPKRYAHFA